MCLWNLGQQQNPFQQFSRAAFSASDQNLGPWWLCRFWSNAYSQILDKSKAVNNPGSETGVALTLIWKSWPAVAVWLNWAAIVSVKWVVTTVAKRTSCSVPAPGGQAKSSGHSAGKHVKAAWLSQQHHNITVSRGGVTIEELWLHYIIHGRKYELMTQDWDKNGINGHQTYNTNIKLQQLIG